MCQAYLFVEVNIVGIEFNVRLFGWATAELHAERVVPVSLDVIDLEVIVVRSCQKMASLRQRNTNIINK